MLKNIPPCLSPELMSILMRMGHGDEIVLADGNFPAESHAQRLVRADGHGVPELLDAILRFFPLDTFVDHPASVMEPVDGATPEPPIWSDYRAILKKHEERDVELRPVERFRFYDFAKSAFAIVASGETAVYANLILKKGVVHHTSDCGNATNP
jgi:L-fucose mutarotase